MQHYLFDSNNRYLYQVPSNPVEPQKLRLRQLPEGEYTLVTVANNTTEGVSLGKLVARKTTLSDMYIHLLRKQGDGSFAPSDELFWNKRRFVAKRNERSHYWCDLANIHCHLEVKVMWRGVPPYASGAYKLVLSGIPTQYRVDSFHHSLLLTEDATSPQGESTAKQVVHKFPAIAPNTQGKYSTETELFGQMLFYKIITLRYTQKYIPTLQLFHGIEPVCKPIPLEKAFTKWGWNPDSFPEQNFRIAIEILQNGTVIETFEK